MKSIVFFLLFVSVTISLTAQKKNNNYRLHIHRTTSPVTIDGILNEDNWKNTEVADDFFMVLPQDTGKAVQHSVIRMSYDEKNIYLAAVFYNNVPGPYFVESLRRDFSFGKNDNFLIFIDPFNNQTTGFSFGVNAAGAQWDGTMYAGGKVDLNWDSKWISAVKQEKDKWVCEMLIPFKSIRYKKGVTEWGINFSRLDLKTSEKSSWTPIPKQFPTASLAYTGVLVWDSPPPEQGINLSVIPYILGAAINENNSDGEVNYDKKIGGDLKLAITSSLNLDLTINPDFSQVEVDRQVTNLDRYELFFPEKRQFFLENGDLFANFGYITIRPFFSRRIGLGVPIQAGARLSGNLNEKWRLGVMDIQTSSIEETGLPNQNFGVISLQRKVFSRSSIGLMLVNKQSFNYPDESELYDSIYPAYNRNLGVEYNLASSNNLWTGKAFLLKSFSPGETGDGYTQAAHLEYKSRKWNWRIQEEYVGEDYSAEVGFVPRKGYIKTTSYAGYLFYPKKSKIRSHGPKLYVNYFFDEKMKNTDYVNFLQYSVNFMNRSSLELDAFNEYVKLLEPFDPTGTGKDSLAAGSKHHWNGLIVSYISKPQSMFTYSVRSRVGGYYEGGNRYSFTSELGYRFQPYVSLSSNISYNYISLPEPWDITDFWLIGSKIDITFTNKIFFSTLFQYNEQSGNFNLNSRFQWRYLPASDLFIVFTNNRLLDNETDKNWSLTLKLTYWFN